MVIQVHVGHSLELLCGLQSWDLKLVYISSWDQVEIWMNVRGVDDKVYQLTRRKSLQDCPFLPLLEDEEIQTCPSDMAGAINLWPMLSTNGPGCGGLHVEQNHLLFDDTVRSSTGG